LRRLRDGSTYSILLCSPKLNVSSFEFLQRSENAFQALHQRISYLEERHAYGPSDEQVERILRKILAERFKNEGQQRTDSVTFLKGDNFFVEDVRSRSTIRPINLDAASLFVEPESVPSKAYAETFRMLEGRLSEYPHLYQPEPVDEYGGIKIERDKSSF
jgi:hypothetical protein